MINVFMCNNNLYLDGYMWKLRCGLKFVKFYWILFILEWEKVLEFDMFYLKFDLCRNMLWNIIGYYERKMY